VPPTTEKLDPVKGMGFTGGGKTQSGEGYGLQPVHKPSGMSRALAPEGQLSLFSARIQAFFRNLFSQCIKRFGIKRAFSPCAMLMEHLFPDSNLSRSPFRPGGASPTLKRKNSI
jgi:hypothetical protein